ncbi:hypothetical protein GCM10008094_19200 [Aidingimonas halophila]|nr:hypothetical protein GCM10008094_19200 [Aidingimonas halophila]
MWQGLGLSRRQAYERGRPTGGKPKRRSFTMDGEGSAQGGVHSASSQACRRGSPERYRESK